MKVLFSCLAICALLAVPALAALPAPENLTAAVASGDLVLDWDDVAGAAKYSVDLELTVTYATDGEPQTVEVELSYGTSDRADGGDMADSDLTIPLAIILEDIAAELGVDPSEITSLEAVGTAKVKALDPGKGKGRQNNPFSAPVDLPAIN